MAERWKTIEGFEAYEVSDLGKVRRKLPGTLGGHKRSSHGSAKVGYILRPSVDTHGYLHICLCSDGKKHSKRIHQLVAMAFLPNPLRLPQVNHTHEKSDNRACKLEWISAADHGRDKAKRGQQGKV